MRRSSGWIDRPPEALADNERVEAATEAVDLDDVADLDSFEPHWAKVRAGRHQVRRLSRCP